MSGHVFAAVSASWLPLCYSCGKIGIQIHVIYYFQNSVLRCGYQKRCNGLRAGPCQRGSENINLKLISIFNCNGVQS